MNSITDDFKNVNLTPEEVESEGFVIDNDQKAEWALRKIADARAEAKRLHDLVEKQLCFYMQKDKDIDLMLEAQTGNLVRLLEDYFNATSAAHKVSKAGRRTYALASGKLVLKPQQPEFKRDDEALINWLGASGKDQYIKSNPSVAWGDLKKVLAVSGDNMIDPGTGEVVPGITVIERKPKFEVEE